MSLPGRRFARWSSARMWTASVRQRPWHGGAVPAASLPSRPRAGRLLLAGLALACIASACDSALDRPSPTAGTVTTAPPTATAESITPVTPDGLLTGPGVSDSTITLGLLVDAARDRGFTQGV